MKSIISLFFCLIVAAGLVAVLQMVQPDWVRQVGLDLWTLPELSDLIEREQGRGRALEGTRQEILQRLELHETVTNDLLAGRLSLLEAIRRVRGPVQESLTLTRRALALQSARSLDGAICRQVLAWAAAHRRAMENGRHELRLARLEAESRELFGDTGP